MKKFILIILLASCSSSHDLKLVDKLVFNFLDVCFSNSNGSSLAALGFNQIDFPICGEIVATKDRPLLKDFARSEVYQMLIDDRKLDFFNYHVKVEEKNGVILKFIVTVIHIDNEYKIYFFGEDHS